MDNQNTNGVNGNNLGQMNNQVPNNNTMNNGSVSPVMPNTTEESSGTSTIPNTPNVVESTIVEETPTIEPVKPTLDSILNGSPVEPAANVDTLESVAPTNTNVENPTPIVPPISNSETNTAPIMESIPNDAVVDTSAIVAPTIETIPENMLKEEPTPVGNPTPIVENTMGEPTVIDLNPTLEEPQVEETPTNVSSTLETPVQPETVNTENIEQLQEVQPINPQPETIEPVSETPMDDFNAVPVPPVFEEEGKGKKKKEGNRKTLIILLLILLVAAIGFGVYYFLTMAKDASTNSITTKEVKVELGNTLSNDIEDYAVINGYNKNDCKLNLDNVNVNKVSTYKYTVTCGKVSEEGTIMVDDTTKPEVITSDLTLLPNSTLNAENFIEECLDASSCSYEFKTDVTNLTSTTGEYDVEILVSDEYNNQNTVTAKLIVSRTAPARYLTCKKNEESIEDISATLVDSYKIGIDANDNFYNAVRISKFQFQDKNKYTTVVNDYNETDGIHGIIGNAAFDENGSSIIIKGNKTLDDMNKELNGKLPSNSNILRAFLSGLGYTCN